LVCYDNNSLEILQLGGGSRGLLQQEIDDGDSYDEAVIAGFRKLILEKSNIKCLSI
jgi:hypothetical protein